MLPVSMQAVQHVSTSWTIQTTAAVRGQWFMQHASWIDVKLPMNMPAAGDADDQPKELRHQGDPGAPLGP